MAYKLTPPIKEVIPLTNADRIEKVTEGATTVTIRMASTGDKELRNSLRDRFKREFNSEGVTISQDVFIDEIEREEVYLTLADCNIEDEDGNPAFEFSNSRLVDKVKFLRAWAKLPPHYSEDIKRAVHEVNKEWGPEGEG